MSEEYDEEIIEWIRKSREQVGELEPVLLTPEGEVIDGKHRLKAYPGWKAQTVQVDDVKKVVERIHRNVHRKLNKKEVKEAVVQLALALEKAGTPKEELVDKIKAALPFSETYIRNFLPAKFKKEYKRKEKPAVRFLAEKPKTPTTPAPTPKPEPKHYLTCPVCGSRLTLKGDVLLPA
jgi:hypothetical protein